METHKEIFTRWLKNAPREGREIVYPFRDWVSDQNIIRCDVCGEYGRMGEEVTYLQDTDWWGDPEHFNVFPATGYWEIDGKPVSAQEAEHGINPKAKWRTIE